MSDSIQKIAFIITTDGWGGLEMNTLKLAGLLSQKGYAIDLITSEKATLYQKGKAVFSNTLLLKKKKKYFDFKSARAIAKFLRQEGISTIMAFDNKDLDVLAWAKTLFYKKMRIIYQQHMQIGINKKDLLHSYRYNAIDYWVAPLQYLKNEVGERTRFPIEKVKVIPIGLEVEKFVQHQYSRAEARQLLHLNPRGKLLGIIGRISEKKGQFFMVRALYELRKQNQNVELLVFGSVTVNDESCVAYYEEMKKYVSDNKLEEVVHFREHNPDVSLFYNSIDVFVLASHAETYGMVTIEAMLSSVPVIATKSGGTSDLLGNGKYGNLFSYNDMNSFMKAFVNCNESNDSKLNETLRYAENNFNISNELEGIIALINEMQ